MCKSDNEPPKADLSTDFSDIKFTVNDNDVIVCDENKWKYENSRNEGMGRSIRSQVNQGNEEINLENNENIQSLNQEIEEKNNRIEDLKSKIKEIDNKIQTMNKILNIDVSEQEYVKDLASKIESEKAKE